MPECPNQQRNLRNCNCTYPCERKGICCECLAYHRRMGEFPACFFSREAERSWDRSFAALVEDRKHSH